MVGGFQLVDETLSIPQGPGLGIEIDTDVLEQFTRKRGESKR